MSIRLSSRCLDILYLLVNSEKPISAAEIGRSIGMSERRVRSSLLVCESWLNENRILIKKVQGKGISLVGTRESRRNLSRLIKEYDNPIPSLPPDHRLQVLLLSLFFADEPQQIKRLQQLLCLSRSTTIRVINAAEEWLKEYDLQLIRRPNYGLLITGKEMDWRDAVVNLLLEGPEEVRLSAMFQGNFSISDISWRMKTGLEKAMIDVLTLLEINQIKNLIRPIDYLLHKPFSDLDYMEFCFYLSLSIYRSRNKKIVYGKTEIEGAQRREDQLATVRKIALRVQRKLSFQLPEEEILWLATKIPESISFDLLSDKSNQRNVSQGHAFVQECTDQILNHVSLSLHPSLGADEELRRSISTFLMSIENQQLHALRSKPVYLNELKTRYSSIYSVALQSCENIAGDLGRCLNEAEIGEITIHVVAAMERLRLSEKKSKRILVVCSAGLATAWLLVSRLRAEFPDVEVVDVISVLELENRKNFDGIDFIIGTAPIKVKNIPSKQINPLLRDEDCKALSNLFSVNKQSSEINQTNNSLNVHLIDLLTSETIELGIEVNNWQELVDQAGAKLVNLGRIERFFVEEMKRMILDHGPYMVVWPGVVLLHAPPNGVNQLCMGLVTLKTAVSFGHPENDPIKIAIVLGAVDNFSHRTALEELNQVMQDEKARISIASTSQKSVVQHWLSKYRNSIKM